INERKWVLLNYPSIIDAFKANTPTEDFFKFAFDAMTFDYKKLSKDLEPLKKLMEKTDKVKIIGPNTDISFSIKNIPAIPCCGECNIPDGEIYTAPVKDSVNGRITYNTASPYNGNVFRNVSLNFKDGKIIEATCDDDNKALNEIFDTDEGSRYIGEFAIGVNKLIEYPIGDILFDEKIKGSIHFTPGKCYDNAQNGNNSAIHWDLVLIQREDFGGGEIYFDDLLIRKDGLFVIDELKHLN
ncbi:MAG: aminopeptidase, partial [Bacilli bacterium]